MKKPIIILLCSFFLSFSLVAQNKAILIGISDYRPESGWRSISAQNDIELLKASLAPDWNVTTLENEKATHDGIIKLLENIASQAVPGDTIFIHFSCHGQQMMPEVVSDDEPDCLDEALIPYDALKNWTQNYKGHNHIRDNELAYYINLIRNSVGENGMVIVTLDACHSDDMHKDDGNPKSMDSTIYRGTSDIFGDPNRITDSVIKKRYARDTSIIAVNSNSDVFYLSACQAHSQNAEIVSPNGIGYGSLSYAIAKTMKNGAFNNIPAFLDQVIIEMDSLVPYQTPGIRASFNYTMPVIQTKSVIEKTTEKKGAEKPHSNTFLYVIASIALLTLIIWRIAKK